MSNEEIFNKLAREGMKEFNLTSFKTTHSSLFAVILKSMDEVKGESGDKELEELRGVACVGM